MIYLLGLLFFVQLVISVAAIIGLIDLDVSQKVGVYTVGYEASARKPFYIAVWRTAN